MQADVNMQHTITKSIDDQLAQNLKCNDAEQTRNSGLFARDDMLTLTDNGDVLARMHRSQLAET